MFSFEPLDRCLYNRITSEDINEYVEQRFVLHSGNDELDNHFFVILGRENVRFFYYDCKRPNPQNTLNVDKLKEIGCVSLTNHKDTGNDILHFPQMSCGSIDDKPQLIANGKKILESLHYLYHSFPFWEVFDKFIKEKDIKEKEEERKAIAKEKEEERNAFAKETKITKFTSWNIVFRLNPTKSNFTDWDFRGRDAKEDNGVKEDNDLIFQTLIKCIFLSFIFQIEDRNEKFAISPLYDHVRNHLRISDVYNLLCAKIRYTLYIPQNSIAYNPEEYSYKARKYADALMSKRINKVIPPHNYPTFNKNAQSWFNDPEEELETILHQNRRQLLLSENPKTLLEDGLVLKIRDFLYTKHAVYQAMTRTIGKRLFISGQILMAITTIIILWAFVNKKSHDIILGKVYPFSMFIYSAILLLYFSINDWKKRQIQNNEHFSLKKQLWVALPLIAVFILSVYSFIYSQAFYVLYIGVVILLLIIIGRSGINNNAVYGGRGGLIYVFFPRILVAELAAWLTIGIAEDLVKSMLWVDNGVTVLVASITVLVLIGLIIGGEVKQHSPYLSFKKIICQRIIPIINHSLFFAILIGLTFQLIFYDNLIKNSDALPSVVYNSYFDDANNYCQNLIDLDKSIKQYQDFCHTSIETSAEGKSTQKHRINDSIETETTVTVKQQTSNKNPKDTDNEVHDILVNNINTIINIIQTNYDKYDSISWVTCFLNRGTIYMLKSKDSLGIDNDSLIKINIEILTPLSNNLPKEITNVRNCIIKYNDYDTLMNWATLDTNCSINTESKFMDALTENARNEKHKCCLKIDVPNSKITSGRLFPTLLIFHTLIVLVLAFITQLIISDKSVTEPL